MPQVNLETVSQWHTPRVVENELKTDHTECEQHHAH